MTAKRFAEVKTDSRNLYKASTRFAEVKTENPKLYNGVTRLAEVKMDPPMPYTAATSFSEAKTYFPWLLHALRKMDKAAKRIVGVKTESPKFY